MTKYSKEYNILNQGFFVSDFTHDLENLVKNNLSRKGYNKKKSPKFYLYSAHDFTIQDIIFSLMGDTLSTFFPPYSSNLYAEVWKNNSSGKLSVRVIYNNRILKVLAKDGSSKPWCDFNSCDYDKFIDVLKKSGIKNPATQCVV
ncbi:hypothetical protein AYI70_g7910 [Smittium culicis]|uniref:2-phosphoxylose phosphatase 1 n=1 Tax=Smittium culicis TaxID=133412 RepID=A0A1R1XIC5_9FUNG|nr:hypothetical protein AYI70_g7910 [Smittium culicis]